MIRKLMHTDNSTATTIIRIALGVVFLAHGAQKVFGWFDGPGFAGAIQYFSSLHVPVFFALLAIAAEFFGSLGLISGFLTRVAAFGIAANMIVAIPDSHSLRFLHELAWEATGRENRIPSLGSCHGRLSDDPRCRSTFP